VIKIVLTVFLLAHASAGSAATNAEKKSTEIIQMVLLKLHRKGKTSVVEYLILMYDLQMTCAVLLVMSALSLFQYIYKYTGTCKK